MVRYLGITGHLLSSLVFACGQSGTIPFDSILLAVNAADVHYLSFKITAAGSPKNWEWH